MTPDDARRLARETAWSAVLACRAARHVLPRETTACAMCVEDAIAAALALRDDAATDRWLDELGRRMRLAGVEPRRDENEIDTLMAALARPVEVSACPVAGHDGPVDPLPVHGDYVLTDTPAPIACRHCARELRARVALLENELAAATDREEGWRLQATTAGAKARASARPVEAGVETQAINIMCGRCRSGEVPEHKKGDQPAARAAGLRE